MKKLFIVGALFFQSLSICAQGAPAQVISDFDDTIRIANSANPSGALYKFLFKKENYAGASEFFNGIKQVASHLNIVSASPNFAKERITKQLREVGFWGFDIYLRDLFKESDVYSYKIRQISKLIKSFSGPLLLLGDDAISDPLVYEAIARQREPAPTKIYIHRISGMRLPDNQSAYTTFSEVAYKEFLDGNMTEAAALKVTDAVLEDESRRLIPKFSVCANRLMNCWESGSGLLNQKCNEVQSRLQLICNARDYL
jgi:phosphatidate phosphatase APP1